MTQQEAGRKLDALIAEHVMGFVWRRCITRDVALKALFPTIVYAADLRGDEVAVDNTIDIPCYSTDIAAAWQVVEHLHSFAGGGVFCPSISSQGEGEWHAHFYAWGASEALQAPVCSAPTAPLAICLAALAATVGPLPEAAPHAS